MYNDYQYRRPFGGGFGRPGFGGFGRPGFGIGRPFYPGFVGGLATGALLGTLAGGYGYGYGYGYPYPYYPYCPPGYYC